MREHISSEGIRTDVIVCSPLTRTLETAAGCFSGLYRTESSDAGKPFMEATAAEQDKCTSHAAVPLPGVPVVACELCRETLGVRFLLAWPLSSGSSTGSPP